MIYKACRIRRSSFWQRRAAISWLWSCAICTSLAAAVPLSHSANATSEPEQRRTRVPTPPKDGEQWQPGLHYSILIGQAKTDVPLGKIEVRELFMYTSPLSLRMQPYLKQWLKNKPNYVEFVRSPSVVFPHARLQARMYFTLEELGRLDLHDALFAWTFEKEHYPIYHTISRPDVPGYFKLNLAFAKTNKLNEVKFCETYESNRVEDKVIEAEIGTHKYLVSGTSTLVVNGKYSTSVQRLMYASGETEDAAYGHLFRLVNYLAAAEASVSE